MTERGKARIGGPWSWVPSARGSGDALRCAAGGPHPRKTRLRAGHALRAGRAVGAGEGSSVGPVSPFGVKVSDIHQAADDLLEPTIAEIGRGADGFEIERKVIEGSAAEVLVNAVHLLAVGSAGTGLPACCPAPSASNDRASCPVVVVHARAAALR